MVLGDKPEEYRRLNTKTSSVRLSLTAFIAQLSPNVRNDLMSNTFSNTTQVETVADGQHNVIISELWNVGSIPNGGYLMAHAAKALAKNSPHPDPLIVTGYYLDKSNNGPAQVQSEVLRTGRSVSTLAGKLIQGDAGQLTERVRLTATFSDLDRLSGPSLNDEDAPSIDPFENCLPVEDIAPKLKMYEQFNMRFDPKCCGWNTGEFKDKAEMNAWLEYKDSSPFDVFSLLMIPDMLPPVIFTKVGANGWVPTLEMTVNVRAKPNTKRVQIRAKTQHLNNSILEEDVEIWDDQGQLLAVSRQIAKLRLKS